MAKRSKRYLDRLDEASELLRQTRQNLDTPSAGSPNTLQSDKPIVKDRLEDFFAENEYEITTAREIPSGPYIIQNAPTQSPGNKRTPRAEKIAYSRSREQLVVKFYKGPWWYYNGIDSDMWDDLKSSDSTGGWLHENGLNSWGDMGEFNPSEMTRANRVMFSAQ